MENLAYVRDEYGGKVVSPNAVGTAKVSTEETRVNGAEDQRPNVPSPPQPAPGASVHLKRSLGPFSAVAVIIGTMIGAGIFVSPQGVLSHTGSVGLSLVIWVACGLLSTLGGLCYIELGCLVPRSGGEFAYLLDSLGPLHGFLGPLSAFSYAWMTSLVTRPANTAIQSLVFTEYCLQPLVGSSCRLHPLAVPLGAVCVTCLASFVNCYSVTLTTAMQNLFTVSKLVVVTVILVSGGYFLATGHTQHLATGFTDSTGSLSDLITAFYSGLWAYDGWNNLNFLTEELVEPARDLPRAIGAGLPLVTACYLLVNVAYLAVLSPQQLLSSPAVAVTFAERALGPLAPLVPLGVALSVYGALNGTVLTTSRLCYTAARAGHFATVLGHVQARRLTPAPAVLFNAALAVAMIAVGDVGGLIDFASFTVWLFHGLATAALLVLRKTRPRAPRPYRVVTAVPCLVLAAAVCLVLVPVVRQPRLMHLYVLAFLLAGVLVYWQTVYRRRAPRLMRRVTITLQKLLELAPSQV